MFPEEVAQEAREAAGALEEAEGNKEGRAAVVDSTLGALEKVSDGAVYLVYWHVASLCKCRFVRF